MEQKTNLLMVLFPLSYLIAANGTMHRGVSQSMELHHDFDRNSRGTAVGDVLALGTQKSDMPVRSFSLSSESKSFTRKHNTLKFGLQQHGQRVI